MASLAGAWIAVVAGFGGMRDHGGSLSFAPQLPQQLSRLAFRLCFQGRRILVEVDHRQVRYSLLQGDAIDVAHHGDAITLASDEPVTRPIPKLPSGEAPAQPPSRAPARRRPK
jgi:alpha,alpha-trehalose phosphorylase